MGITSNVWPVNEKNEIITETGTGTRNVVGFLPQDQIPLGNKGILTAAPEQVIAQFASPSSGGFSVTGNTSMQYFEIADLTGKLNQDSIINADITFSYTMNTNGKTIYYYVGPNTSTLTSLASSTRTSGTETGFRALFQFAVVDSNTLFRISTALGAIGASGSTVGTLAYNTLQPTKLYVGVQLANASDTITCHCSSVKVSHK